MTLMQFAFVLLCLAQIIHFSKHLCLLTMRLWEEAAEERMRDRRVRGSVDWKSTN